MKEKSMYEKIKGFYYSFKESVLYEKIKVQLYSFIKTYFTVFIGLYLFGIDKNGKDPLDFVFIKSIAIFSMVSVVRNFYKLLTEK